MTKDRPVVTLAQVAKAKLDAGYLQLVGDPSKPVQRIALACGAAGEYLKNAMKAGADAFLTGEMRFHDCLTARDSGISVLLPGHHATERPGVEDLAARLAEAFPATVWASRQERDPIGVIV